MRARLDGKSRKMSSGMNDRRTRRSAPVIIGTLFVGLSASLLLSCGSGSAPTTSPPPTLVPLTAADVQAVVEDAAKSLNVPMVIAVADRAGRILAVFQNAGAPTTSIGNFGASVDSHELAVALARTA